MNMFIITVRWAPRISPLKVTSSRRSLLVSNLNAYKPSHGTHPRRVHIRFTVKAMTVVPGEPSNSRSRERFKLGAAPRSLALE